MVDNYCQTILFSPTSPLPNVMGGSWLNLVFLGLLGTALLMALVYMISKAMRIPRLEGWSRHEMFQILATAGLAILMTGLIYGMCSFNIAFLSPDPQTGLYGGNNGQEVLDKCGAFSLGNSGTHIYQLDVRGNPIVTPFCAAQAYLQKVKGRGEFIFVSMVGVNSILTQLFRITYESRPLGIGYTLEPLAGLQQIQNVFLVAVSGFMISYLSLLVQMRILDYMVLAVPWFFMPLGVLLRCFVPTREFGGAIMGFCFASLLMFPIILVLNDVLIFSSLDSVTDQAKLLNSQLYPGANAQGVEPSLFDPAAAGDAIDKNWGMYDSKQTAGGDWVPKTQADPQAPVSYFTAPDPSVPNEVVGLGSKEMTTTLLWPFSILIVFSIAGILLPIINFLIYIEIARGLSKLLGAEMDLSNLTRMI